MSLAGSPAVAPSTVGELPDELLARAFLIRAAEQRLLTLFAEGKLFGTVHTCIGQEWSAVAVGTALRPGDLIFSNHRCHGHYLAHGGDVDKLIAEVMGRESGLCAGRGGSQHLCGPGFYSNGVQGGIVPVAAGLAMGLKRRETGNIAAVFIGDGTLGEGAVYESLNIASKWELPLLVVLENNLYAQSTPQTMTLAGDIEARAAAFGIATARGSTDDPADLLRTAAACAARVREFGKPVFLRIDTLRLMAHSKGDDDRDPDEVKRYWQRDHLQRFEASHPEQSAKYLRAATQRVDEAVALADQSPYPQPITPVPESRPALQWEPTAFPHHDRVVNLIHAGLQRAMRADESILLIGEDIEGPYGGAFKVTKLLSQEFAGRVRNTPISEAALVGIGNGLALQGYKPVCEVMFGDFLTLAFDQLLNHASKFKYTYNDQVTLPLIVRTPMGGKRGYGATHSQSIEKHFLGMPDTQVIAIHHRFDPGVLYDRLFATIDRPTLVVENKLLYGVRVGDHPLGGFHIEHTNEPFPTTRLRPDAEPEVTLLCYGGMLPDVEKAVDELFEAHDLACEVIVPARLYPFDERAVLESVAKTGLLVVIEEGISFAAFGAEVITRVAEAGLPARVKRVGPPEIPIPSCGPLEKQLLPGPGQIVHAVLAVVAHD